MKNILLVDDDRVNNFLSEKVLEQLGLVHGIRTALNGEEALDLFNGYYMEGSNLLPDIILLDLNMPIMDGFGFLTEFEKLDFPDKEKVNVIIVTSSYDPRDIERARELGVRHYLAKPLEPEGLLAVLNELDENNL